MVRFVVRGTLAALLLSTPVVQAAEKKVEGNYAATAGADKSARALHTATFPLARASRILGEKVQNAQGEKVGNITELAFDVHNRRIGYAVVDAGGYVGAKEKYFAVPFVALTGADKGLVLNADQSRLKDANGFDITKWPDLADMNWGKETYAFYGATPYWDQGRLQGEPISTERVVVKKRLFGKDEVIQRPVTPAQPKITILKANADLLGHPVKHASNDETIGEIDDLIVDPRNGDLAFVVLKLDRKSSAVPYDKNKDYVALPSAMFMWNRYGGDPSAPYAVECCFIKLREHRFSPDKFPDLSSKKWAEGLYDDFGRPAYWTQR